MGSLDNFKFQDFWNKLEDDTKLDDEQKLKFALIKLILDNNEKFLKIKLELLSNVNTNIDLLGSFDNE